MAVLEGRAYWSFVTTPNTKFTPAYSVNLVVDDEVADGFEYLHSLQGEVLILYEVLDLIN